MKPRALYIHVPFCARRCGYCDFAVEATRDPPVSAWLAAIGRELALTAAEQEWLGPLELDTLYIGGGTPSLLGMGAMTRLRETLAPHLSLVDGAEWTCEANPESFTPELARDWVAAGVNRLSLGAQTFDPEALRWMGRLHGPGGSARALAAARDAGFDNVSIDLIFALPSRLGRDWDADLARVIELGPEHVSLYGLTAEPGAPLGRRVAEGGETLPDEDCYADEYLLAHERLSDAGYEHYEVSNFAKAGRRSRHNAVYWNGSPYAAAGPGAHAYLPPVRRWNIRSWSSYRDRLDAGILPVDGAEAIDADAEALERAWLGLRTSDGLGTKEATEAEGRLFAGWVRAGLAIEEAGILRLTTDGWLLLDRLAVDLHAARGAPALHSRRAPIDGSVSLVQISSNSNLARS